MSLFSKIGSLYKEKPSDSIMDDNIAVSAGDNNPFVSATVIGARNAYDTLHSLMSPLIKGKKSSLKQIDSWLDEWLERLKQIEEAYAEILSRINDLGADFTGTFTFDVAKEAWELVQDTPILRRYMGEANYWLLYDTVGILSTQAGSLAGDLLAGVKEAIRQALLALISMTDGLLCLESYLGMIQQYWGALYFKITPLPLLDSIVPNVTTAYWYKPPIPSEAGTEHKVLLNNNSPGQGFTPLPLPMPNPTMVTRQASYLGKFDYQNPDTWYLNGTPYYLPNTMYLLERALQYWGSSYTNEWLPALNNFYNRRPYGEGENVDGKWTVTEERSHPLRVGHTLSQLDTSLMSINGSNVSLSDSDSRSVSEIFAAVISSKMVAAMDEWQQAYEKAYGIFTTFILEGFRAYNETPSTLTRFWELQQLQPQVYVQYDVWRYSTTDTTAIQFRQNVQAMTDAWKAMFVHYVTDNNLPANDVSLHRMFDAVMGALVEAGHTAKGYPGSMDDIETYMVCPSFATTPIGTPEQLRNYGIPFVAYKVNSKNNRIYHTSSGNDTVLAGDYVNVGYAVDKFGMVMFPSDSSSDEVMYERITSFNFVASTVFSVMTDVSEGLKVGTLDPQLYEIVGGDSVNSDASVLAQYPDTLALPQEESVLGRLPEALHMHRSSMLLLAKVLSKNDSAYYLGNIFFPDGKVPESADSAIVPETFVTCYRSFNETYSGANEELADIVGYSIDHGRETKFPCFGIYGELLSMQSWHYKEMPYLEFTSKYSKVKSGYSLYYEKNNPGHVIYYHSSYVSQSRQMQMAVIHEALDSTSKSYGPNDSYTFYIYPCESVSVTKLSGSPSLGSFLSVDAVSPGGEEYHYIPMRNPIPKCAKYVDPEKWSMMDIIHELYLLAVNLSGLCGDNGERLKNLQDDLSEFHISTPQFIGQLPANNGQYSPFRFEIFKDYSDRIEAAVNSIYDFRAKIIAATEAF